MKNRYGRAFTSVTPQFQRIPGSEQIRNRGGGWSFPVTDEVQLSRFLIMGTAENTYYAKAEELTREAARCVERLIEEGKGVETVRQIAEISRSGRAVKNDPAIFALAMSIKMGDVETRRAAADMVPQVCRTATHFFQFLELVKLFSKAKGVSDKGEMILAHGWGRVMKRAIQNWLDSKKDDQLAYQFIKYRQREGWTARDVLRKAKPKAVGERDLLYSWAANHDKLKGSWDELPEILNAFEEVQKATEWGDVCRLVKEYSLPWEAVPSQWARNIHVQNVLFETMPITATIRQLGRLTNLGLLTATSDATKMAIQRITNPVNLQRGRVHPMSLYLAEEVYSSGGGIRSKMTWTPIQSIVDALGQAYFQSFGEVQPSGKNIVIGVDISQSMSVGGVMGIAKFQACEAAAASALTLARIEPNSIITVFDTACQMRKIPKLETLRELKAYARNQVNPNGGTDCSQPIVWAHQNVHDVDAFCIFTDHETWRGNIHPVEALWQYRRKWDRPAKLAAQAFVPHAYGIAPQVEDDAGYLNVAGMDENAPRLITDFLR